MKTAITTTSAGVLAGLLVLACAHAQQDQITRTDLQRHDLGIPGREVIQARVDLAPGARAPGHTHPGEEIIYVLSGTFEYRVGNGPPLRVSAGEVLFVPARTVHSARNVGDSVASELATYIVEKGEPLSTLAE
jgi:quercetin dioxygenase-like cupin family protein